MRLSIREPESLIDTAIAKTGLRDFGPGSFREALGVLVDSVNRDIDLTEAGVQSIEETIVRTLSNRLQIEAWYVAHPETAQTTIGAMTLVVGLPRSGTTALVGMLAADEGFRALRQWEAGQPCPPPIAGAEADDPRLIAATAFAGQLPPELKAMHIVDPIGPEEDFELMALAFRSGHYQGFWPVETYKQWALSADMSETWAWHERCLKLLGSRRPPDNWLLKAPLHLFELSGFLDRYPEARFVMTHRDPARTVPSNCSLTSWAHAMVTPSLDPQRHGQRGLAFWAEGMRRALRARDVIGEDRFIDVFHNDLIADPMREIERVYAFLGRDMSPAARAAIGSYISANAAHGPSPHQYTAEQFGLTTDGIRAEFHDYVERFDLAPVAA